ncbi:MAG: late competence development ComFB family protein [Clostridia bacterium]|jgi:competence protein ComFB|nr:late competence development ComFB family protein [Clostridia bacterium]MCI1999881.1 late competence development ComFB family protein [Clostridia bacterium]MCI2014203.1 late competence development ComFB family protein [Clostridia bacterium]
MSRKTNKTAHVLKLISKSKEEHKLDDDLEIEPNESDITNDLSFIDVDIAKDNKVSEKVKERLSEIADDGDINASLNSTKQDTLSDILTNQNDTGIEFNADELDTVDAESLSDAVSDNDVAQNETISESSENTDENENTDYNSAESNDTVKDTAEILKSQTESNTESSVTDSESASKSSFENVLKHVAENMDEKQAEDDTKKVENAAESSNTAENDTKKAPETSAENDTKKAPETSAEISSQESNNNGIEYQYVNVFEEIVKSRIDEFLKLFDVCTCPRCKVDVMALALNGLPAKYIVVDSSYVSPLLNFFSSQYKGAVTAQLSRACSVVKNNPHH